MRDRERRERCGGCGAGGRAPPRPRHAHGESRRLCSRMLSRALHPRCAQSRPGAQAHGANMCKVRWPQRRKSSDLEPTRREHPNHAVNHTSSVGKLLCVPLSDHLMMSPNRHTRNGPPPPHSGPSKTAPDCCARSRLSMEPRRRWALDQPNHVLPTEQGDYVMLVRPADTARADVCSCTPAPVTAAAAHSKPDIAAAQAESDDRLGSELRIRPSERPLPLPPLQRAPPLPAPVPNILQGVLEARPLLPPPRCLAAPGGAAPSAPLGRPAPAVALRAQAREDSVSRLRRAVQRADDDLVAALRDSELTAAVELVRGGADAGIPRPQTMQQEEAQLNEAIQASALEASKAERAVVARGREGELHGCAAATPEAMRSKAAGKRPMACVNATDSPTAAATDSSGRGDASGSGGSSSGGSSSGGGSSAGGSSNAAASAAVGTRLLRSRFDVPLALRPLAGPDSQCAQGTRRVGIARPEAAAAEERRQLERAIAESAREAERRAADERHDRQVMLRGFIDSLGQSRSVAAGRCRGDATNMRRTERDVGREMARKALEQHLASGAVDI